MFLIDNAVPFRNAVLIQGHFQTEHPRIMLGDQLIATKDGKQVGMVRIYGILNANFSHNPSNPRYHISVGFEKEKDYRVLIGATLNKL